MITRLHDEKTSVAKANRILATNDTVDRKSLVPEALFTPASISVPPCTANPPLRNLSLFSSGSGRPVSVSAASIAKAGLLFRSADDTSADADAISRIAGSCAGVEGAGERSRLIFVTSTNE